MQQNNTFHKVTGTERHMYGPEKLLVCGYAKDEHKQILRFLSRLGFEAIPVVFVSNNDAHTTLHDLLKRKGNTGIGKDSGLKRAVIMSGFTEKNLTTLLSAYRKEGLPKQLWATLTPTSEKWPINFLLNELQKEAEAINARRKE